jgi:beta-N-acetylhexosaminidase
MWTLRSAQRYSMTLSARKYSKKIYARLIFVACCIPLLLSGSAGPAFGHVSAPSPRRTHTTSSIIVQPTLPNTDDSTPQVSAARLRTVQRIMEGMSLDQKLGQLLIVEYLGNSYQGSGLQYMIKQQFVGGFMYQESNNNFDAPDNTVHSINAFSQQAQVDANIPLLIATDQEGGLVNRLYTFHGDLPSAQDMAASGDPHVAFVQGVQDATWLAELGINADLAPVVDVHTVDPPILETRMFGSDPQTVVTYAGAFLNGLQENGIAGCLKHFPGLGAITSDPHSGLPTVNRSMADLEKIDLAPYRLLIPQERPAMIMATDVLMPAIDPTLPAELSPKAIDGILRGELGYNGVVITDGLYMSGISDQWTLSQATVMAIEAGDDLIEGPFTPDQVASVISALKQALQQGQLNMDRIDQSVQRILLMKMQYKIIK